MENSMVCISEYHRTAHLQDIEVSQIRNVLSPWVIVWVPKTHQIIGEVWESVPLCIEGRINMFMAAIRDGNFHIFKPIIITRDECLVVTTPLDDRMHVFSHELDKLLGLWTTVSSQPGIHFLVFQAFTFGKEDVLLQQGICLITSDLSYHYMMDFQLGMMADCCFEMKEVLSYISEFFGIASLPFWFVQKMHVHMAPYLCIHDQGPQDLMKKRRGAILLFSQLGRSWFKVSACSFVATKAAVNDYYNPLYYSIAFMFMVKELSYTLRSIIDAWAKLGIDFSCQIHDYFSDFLLMLGMTVVGLHGPWEFKEDWGSHCKMLFLHQLSHLTGT
ncbi:hypothetical protein KI387_016778 [Taxus chinensis]|uniref:Uncharacterized protein n=1 Tax=Taxus chinensis TaxID=29808 RepID=A0AA38GHW3_TAXCH|nr:hypothetical protein KI387_016778 [Taxus chinensis]